MPGLCYPITNKIMNTFQCIQNTSSRLALITQFNSPITALKGSSPNIKINHNPPLPTIHTIINHLFLGDHNIQGFETLHITLYLLPRYKDYMILAKLRNLKVLRYTIYFTKAVTEAM
jgi:hypothetical protein